MTLHVVKAVLSATVVVPDEVFARHSPFDPHGVGQQVAEQVDNYARREALGYYPALDYFQGRDVLDQQLVEVLDQLTWLETSLVRDELRLRLRPLFASVQVQSMQAVAYSMPQVRPHQPNALQKLTAHFTPNRAKFDVLLTLFRKIEGNQNLDNYIQGIAHRHLCQAFDTIEIGNIKILE
ncbi:hypothetical protein [Thiogranum longum]